jgi:para-nitrobenzyl esterase
LAVPQAKGLFAQAIAESPANGMVPNAEIAAEAANEFVALLGADRSSGAAALMSARPAELVEAVDTLLGRSLDDMRGAFALGPASGTEHLPLDPIEAMRSGRTHQVPLIIGNNGDEGRLFTRFLQLLPVNEAMIETLLARTDAERRAAILAAYPGYPNPAACVSLGGDFAFGSATWQIAEAHSAHAPTYVYRYDFAPLSLKFAGLGATHAMELLAVFDTYRSTLGSLLTGLTDRRAARTVSDDVQDRWQAFSRTGRPGPDWPAYTAEDRAVRVFDRKPRLEFNPRAQRREAWAGFSLTAS